MLGFIPWRILSYCGAFIVNTSIRYIKNRHKPIFAGHTVEYCHSCMYLKRANIADLKADVFCFGPS